MSSLINCYAEYHVLFAVVVSVVLLSVIMLSLFILSLILLSVVMLSVIMLSDVAPRLESALLANTYQDRVGASISVKHTSLFAKAGVAVI